MVPYDCGTSEFIVNKRPVLLRLATWKKTSLTKKLTCENWKTKTAKSSWTETKLKYVFLLHYKSKWVLASIEGSYSEVNLPKMCMIWISSTLNQLLHSQILSYLFM